MASEEASALVLPVKAVDAVDTRICRRWAALYERQEGSRSEQVRGLAFDKAVRNDWRRSGNRGAWVDRRWLLRHVTGEFHADAIATGTLRRIERHVRSLQHGARGVCRS